MDRTGDKPAKTQDHGLPLITVTLVAYNQERFIRGAVEGAFAQTYSPLEIILSDDCSSDGTFDIMEQMARAYTGPHRIILNRNRENLGIGGHVNRVMELAGGELIVVAAGDDISVPERVRKIYEVYRESGGTAKSIFSNHTAIDANGRKLGVHFARPPDESTFLPEVIVENQFILSGCAQAFAPEVFSLFGPLTVPLTCDDMAIPFRSALIGHIRYIDEELVLYRRHATNIWQHSVTDYARWEHFQIREKLAIFDNWLKDLARFETLYPERRPMAESLRGTILRRLESAKRDLDVFEGSWIGKARYLLHEWKKGTPFQEIRFQIGILLVPGIYNRYMKMKNKYILKKVKY
ncbi:MAG: glycosyltransferase [Syntrophobacteraceae bacterium]